MTNAEWNRNVEQDADGYDSLAASAEQRANETQDKKDRTQTTRWREQAKYYKAVAAKIRGMYLFDLTELDAVYEGVRI